MISIVLPEQIRAARAILGWSQDELASAAHVSKPTIADFERHAREPMVNNLSAIRRACEEAGIQFIEEEEDGRIGVLFIKSKPTAG
jgi:transcriptional regulator with XRE-family HTH domain